MDPIVGGALIGGASNIIGSLFNTNSQDKANKHNEKLMRESWAREDTAHQRATKDMRAAGLNPLLAAGSSAASSAPIQVESTKSGDAFSSAGSAAASAGEKYLQQQMAENQIDITQAQIDHIKAETRKANAEADWINPMKTAEHANISQRTSASRQQQTIDYQAHKLRQMVSLESHNSNMLSQAQAREIAEYNLELSKEMNLRTTESDRLARAVSMLLGRGDSSGFNDFPSGLASTILTRIRSRFGSILEQANAYGKEAYRSSGGIIHGKRGGGSRY